MCQGYSAYLASEFHLKKWENIINSYEKNILSKLKKKIEFLEHISAEILVAYCGTVCSLYELFHLGS